MSDNESRLIADALDRIEKKIDTKVDAAAFLSFKDEIKEHIRLTIAPLEERVNAQKSEINTAMDNMSSISRRFNKWSGVFIGAGVMLQVTWFFIQDKVKDLFHIQ